MDLDDLVAYGAMGLVEAASRFEERGVPFTAFARRRIYGAMVDGIRTHHWFGRRADRGLRIDRVGHEWQIAVGADDQADNHLRWNGRPMVGPPPGMANVNGHIGAALRSLPVLEGRLVELCYYQEKTLTQAAKDLGICRPRASRLHARALRALRATIEGDSSPLPPRLRNPALAADRPEDISRGQAVRGRHGRRNAQGAGR